MARRRRVRLRAIDYVLIVIIIGALTWAFVPGLGLDLGTKVRQVLQGQARPVSGAQVSTTPQVPQQSAEQILAGVRRTPFVAAVAQLPTGQLDRNRKYNRDAFGPAWADVDSNGCDTRNDVLKRDLQQVRFRAGSSCVVASGLLADPYTGTLIKFKRGKDTSSAVQIDHVVALGNAWRTGAYSWSPARREQYANDPLVLLAVDGPANQQKSDQAADTWLPANEAFRCAYVARQVAIKTKWHLWVTDAEKRVMAEVAKSCPDEPLPRG